MGFSSGMAWIARDMSTMRLICETSTERNDATAPRMKAGAAAWDITSES